MIADIFFDVDTRPPGELPAIPADVPRHRGNRRPWVRNADDTGAPPAVTRELHRDGEPMTVLADPKDSKRGRYFGRASSYGKPLEDMRKIEQADQRRIAFAFGRHPELVKRSQAVTYLDRDGLDAIADDRARAKALAQASADRDELEAIARKAVEYAKGDAASTKGTAFHRLRERRDQGEDLSYLDPLTLEGLATWERLLTPFELIGSEQFVVNDELESAGTYDALLKAVRTITIRHPKTREVLGQVEAGEAVVGDLKSGKWGPEWFGPTYGCQALVYAGARPYTHALGRYDWAQAPSQRWAVIPYVSLDRLDAAGLHWIDLDRARLAVEAVARVKAARADRMMFIAHSDEPMPADLAAAGQRAVSPIVAGPASRLAALGEAAAAQLRGRNAVDIIAENDPRDAELIAHLISADLLDTIAQASGKVELSRLWAVNADVWTDEHTAAGRARLAQLGGAG